MPAVYYPSEESVELTAQELSGMYMQFNVPNPITLQIEVPEDLTREQNIGYRRAIKDLYPCIFKNYEVEVIFPDDFHATVALHY